MLRPTQEQLALLRGFERAAFFVSDAMNRHAPLKRLGQGFLNVVARNWIHFCTRHLRRVHQIENFPATEPDKGIFLVANHRSFFDLYMVSCVFLRHTSWVKRMFFPVRSSFFYESVAGVLVNGAMSFWAMYPPVLRDPARKAFNHYTLDCMSELLQAPGTIVGYHPEGKRSKSDNPYELLPASQGTGEIIYRARPIVLPVFVLGLQNNIVRQIRSNFDGTGTPITVTFGEPLNLDDLYAQPASPEVYRAIAERVRDAITAVGAEERSFRKAHNLHSVVPDPPAQVTMPSMAPDGDARDDVNA